MKKLTVICLVIACNLIAGYAAADESYTCSNGPQQRIISVVSLDPAADAPCEVRYEKDGVTTTLWSAQNEVGYCEEKARAFVDKQQGWGWSCTLNEGAQ